MDDLKELLFICEIKKYNIERPKLINYWTVQSW